MSITQIEFINRCVFAHGNKFDYSLVEYVSARSKIKIICNACRNIWEVIPGNFTHNKTGCPICKKNKHIERCAKEQYSTEEFIKICNTVHGYKYDYSESLYRGGRYKINIICPIHGLFSQVAYDHKAGIGCNNCRIEKILSTKIQKGLIINPADMSDVERYRREVWLITERSYREFGEIINPDGLPRGNDYHLDHIFSINAGYNHNIDPAIIGHYTNLNIIEAKENHKKYTKCNKTYAQLIEDYNLIKEKDGKKYE